MILDGVYAIGLRGHGGDVFANAAQGSCAFVVYMLIVEVTLLRWSEDVDQSFDARLLTAYSTGKWQEERHRYIVTSVVYTA